MNRSVVFHPEATHNDNRGIRRSGILSLVALLGVICSIVAATQVLRQQAVDGRKAQLAVAGIRHQLDDQYGDEGRAISDPNNAGSLIRRSNELNSEIINSINALATQHVPTADIQHIRRDVAAYQQSLSSEYSILQSGNWDQARQVDISVTQPAFVHLDEYMDQQNALMEERAAHKERIANVGSLLVLLVGICLSIFVVWQQGKGRQAVNTARTLRRSEDRFRSLLHNSSDVIVVTDYEGNILYVTPSNRELVVFDETDGAVRQLDAYLHVDSARELRGLLSAGLSGNTPEVLQWRAPASDGSWREIEGLTNDLSDDPNVNGVVFTLRDVSSRHRLEAELRQSQKLEAVGRLAGGVAHEINTPIQYISDNVRFVSDSLAPVLQRLQGDSPAQGDNADDDTQFILEEVPKALADSLTGLERVAHIVRTLKRFGQDDHNEPTSVDINEMISSALLLANSEVRDRADVVTQFDSLPLLTGYASGLNQAWLNLLLNAAEAMDATQSRRGTLTVHTHADDQHVVVEIRDTGRGMTDDVAHRAFEPFYTTKEFGRGTGQGLTQARKCIVEQHGGAISFETQPGVGTLFIVTLPLS